MNTVTGERLEYLRDYLRDKLEEGDANGDLFLDDRHDRILWISGDGGEVIVITLEPGKIEVQT